MEWVCDGWVNWGCVEISISVFCCSSVLRSISLSVSLCLHFYLILCSFVYLYTLAYLSVQLCSHVCTYLPIHLFLCSCIPQRLSGKCGWNEKMNIFPLEYDGYRNRNRDRLTETRRQRLEKGGEVSKVERRRQTGKQSNRQSRMKQTSQTERNRERFAVTHRNQSGTGSGRLQV